MDRLIIIRQQQGEIYKELLLFQMRILYKFLPNNFDELQYFIAPIAYIPLNDNKKIIELKNKSFKTIQEAKRSWLFIFLKAYEMKLQHLEHQYQNEFLQLESQLLNSVTVDGLSVFNQIKKYMISQTHKLKQQIYKNVSISRHMLLQMRQHSSLSRKNMIGVSPEPYLDLISNPFNSCEWNYLSFGKIYSQ